MSQISVDRFDSMTKGSRHRVTLDSYTFHGEYIVELVSVSRGRKKQYTKKSFAFVSEDGTVPKRHLKLHLWKRVGFMGGEMRITAGLGDLAVWPKHWVELDDQPED